MTMLPKGIKPKVNFLEAHRHNYCLCCGNNYDKHFGECPKCQSRRRRANE